jgi:hypothetical protein
LKVSFKALVLLSRSFRSGTESGTARHSNRVCMKNQASSTSRPHTTC